VSAVDRAHAQLRAEILDWRLAPGAVLGEVEQATRLGVSRTPLREAIGRLRAEGLVTWGPGRAAVVTDLAPDDVDHLFELREALEGQAVRLAARRRSPGPFEALAAELERAPQMLAADAADPPDPEHGAYYAVAQRLDDAIDDAAGNPYLRDALAGLRTHLVRVRRVSRDDPDRLRAAAAEHLVLVRAILDRDETLAAQALGIHLHHSRTHVRAAFDRSPAPKEVTSA
jgi:DNA-binding GntR family transcriptional regulator